MIYLKGPILALKQLREDQESKSDNPLKLSLLVKPRNSIGKQTVQGSEFVRWSSAFHHVFVFTAKKRCPVH